MAEELGFPTAWVGDHLAFRPPWLDSLTSLAAGFTATSRIRLGTSVLLGALREPAWLAKQVATLQYISANRLQLGLGAGGENPDEWTAVAVPRAERFRRTDAILEALPALLSGEPCVVPAPYDRPVPALLPAAPTPPLWVGGRADGALRRAVRLADGWLGAFVSADRIPEQRGRLSEIAAECGRPVPAVGMSVFVHVDPSVRVAEDAARSFFAGLYGMDLDRVRRYCVLGDVETVTEGLAAYAAAGVTSFTLVPLAIDVLQQYERLAHVREAVVSLDLPGTARRRDDAGRQTKERA